MKRWNERAFLLFLAMVLFVSLPGCSAVKASADEYNELLALVQSLQSTASNFQAVTDTQYARVQAETQNVKAYYEEVAQGGEAWAGQFRTQAEALTDLQKNYRDTNGNPVDPTQLNLSALQSQGALPDELGKDFTLYATAITQAPPPAPEAEVTLTLSNTIDEAMTAVELAGFDWNDAVQSYNTRRAQIKDKIVARVSAYFGFELPAAFPYYASGRPCEPVEDPPPTSEP
jgi:hypothetical protein